MPFVSGGGGFTIPANVIGGSTQLVLTATGGIGITGLGAAHAFLDLDEEASANLVLVDTGVGVDLTGLPVTVRDGSNVIRGEIAADGTITTRKNAAPADGTLSNGELSFWFDSVAPGALKIKAKDDGGTVRAATIVLV